MASTGLNLALHYLSGASTFDPLVTKVAPELASLIVWLDCLTLNVDHTARHTNMLMWHHELWLIEHGAALYQNCTSGYGLFERICRGRGEDGPIGQLTLAS